MAGELVTGYLRLVPTVQGIQGATARALVPATREAETAGLRSGTAFGRSLSRNIKNVVKGGLAGGALFAGVVAKKGIDRLLGIEDARASLAGLGNDAKTVDKIMTNALDSVRGTAFGMADAGKVAASAVAAGIKPGKALTDNLKLIADAATIAKVPLNEMGAVFNKVAASNKIQGDVIAQLGDMGIPIVQLLSKELGKSASETLTLASKGKINFATFSKAMQEGLGGAAQKSGETTRGAWANMNASLGRIGANLLVGLFPKIKGGFKSITDFLVPLEGKATSFGAAINEAFSGIDDTLHRVKVALGNLDFNNIDGAKLGKSISSGLSHALDDLGSLSSKLFDKIGDVMGQVDWVGLGITVGTQAIPFVLGLATGIINGVGDPGLWAGIWHHLPDILWALLAVAFAPSKIAGPIGRVLGRIPFAGKFLEAIVKGLQRIGRKITGVAGEMLGSLWKGIIGGRFAGSGIGQLISKVMFPFFQLYPRVASFGLKFGQRLLQAGHSGMRYLGVAIGDGIASVLRFFIRLPGRILRALGSLARLLWPSGGRVIGGLLSGARDRFVSVLSWAGRIGSRIKGAIKGAGKLLSSIGGSIVEGLLSGLRGAWHKVTDWISNKINGLSKVAKKLLHINSPSKVFSEIGHSIGEGMQEGIAASMPLVDAAVGNMATGAVRAGSTAARGSYATGRGARAAASPVASTSRHWVTGTANLHPDSRVTIEGIVEDVVTADGQYQSSVDRMAGRR